MLTVIKVLVMKLLVSITSRSLLLYPALLSTVKITKEVNSYLSAVIFPISKKSVGLIPSRVSMSPKDTNSPFLKTLNTQVRDTLLLNPTSISLVMTTSLSTRLLRFNIIE